MDILFPKDGDSRQQLPRAFHLHKPETFSKDEMKAFHEPSLMGKLYNGLNSARGPAFFTRWAYSPWERAETNHDEYLKRLGAGTHWPMPLVDCDLERVEKYTAQCRKESLESWKHLTTLFCTYGDVLDSAIQKASNELLRDMVDKAWAALSDLPRGGEINCLRFPENAHEDWRLWSCHTRGSDLVNPDPTDPNTHPLQIPLYDFTPAITTDDQPRNFDEFTEFCNNNRLIFQFPCLNMEYIMNRKALVSFISSRALRQPSEFVTKDLDAMHIGRTGRLLEIPFCGRSFISFGDPDEEWTTKLLAGEDGFEEYGTFHDKIMPAEGRLDPIILGKHSKGRVMAAGDGLVVMETQIVIHWFCSALLCLLCEETPSGLPPVPPKWPIKIPDQPEDDAAYMKQAAGLDKFLYTTADKRRFCQTPEKWYKRAWSQLDRDMGNQHLDDPWMFQMTSHRGLDMGLTNDLFEEAHDVLKGHLNKILSEPAVFQRMVRDEMLHGHHYGLVARAVKGYNICGPSDGGDGDHPEIDLQKMSLSETTGTGEGEEEQKSLAEGQDHPEQVIPGYEFTMENGEEVRDSNKWRELRDEDPPSDEDGDVPFDPRIPHFHRAEHIDAKRALANDVIRRSLRILFFGLEIFASLGRQWKELHSKRAFQHPVQHEYILFVCLLRHGTSVLFGLLQEGGFIHAIESLRPLCRRNLLPQPNSHWTLPRGAFEQGNDKAPRVFPHEPDKRQLSEKDLMPGDDWDDLFARIRPAADRVLFAMDQGPPSKDYGIPSMVEVTRSLKENVLFNRPDNTSPLLGFLVDIIPRMLMLDRSLDHHINFADHRIRFHPAWSGDVDKLRAEEFGNFMKIYDEFPFEDHMSKKTLANVHRLLGIKYFNSKEPNPTITEARDYLTSFRTRLLNWMADRGVSRGYQQPSKSEKAAKAQRKDVGVHEIAGRIFEIGEFSGRITTQWREPTGIIKHAKGPTNMTGVKVARKLEGPHDNEKADHSKDQGLRNKDWEIIQDLWGPKEMGNRNKVKWSEVSKTLCRMGFKHERRDGSSTEIAWHHRCKLPEPAEGQKKKTVIHVPHHPDEGWHLQGARKMNIAKQLAKAFNFDYDLIVESYDTDKTGAVANAQSVQVFSDMSPRKRRRSSDSEPEGEEPRPSKRRVGAKGHEVGGLENWGAEWKDAYDLQQLTHTKRVRAW